MATTLPWEDPDAPVRPRRRRTAGSQPEQAPGGPRPVPDGPVEFFVRGIPQPKGSARGFAIPAKGQFDALGQQKYRAVVTSDNVRLKGWELTVLAESMIAARGRNFGTAPIAVEIEFRLPRPKSLSVGKRPFPIVPPDVDKLARGAIDGLGATLFFDDAQVVSIVCRKIYVHPPEAGANILVRMERP